MASLHQSSTRTNLKMDQVQIQQVLLNPAMNRLNAMMEGARPRVLEIRSEISDPGTVVITAKDCGPGSAKQLVRISYAL